MLTWKLHIQKSNGGVIIPAGQHEEIANKYVIFLTSALLDYNQNISEKEAWGLAWGGLENTPFFNTQLSNNQRAEINEINRKHRNKSSNNTSDKLGTYCN